MDVKLCIIVLLSATLQGKQIKRQHGPVLITFQSYCMANLRKFQLYCHLVKYVPIISTLKILYLM